MGFNSDRLENLLLLLLLLIIVESHKQPHETRKHVLARKTIKR